MTVWAMIGDRRGRLALLFALMLASAATEGLALVLFVPMLAAIGGGFGGVSVGGMPRWASGRVGQLLAEVGVPQTLGALLIVFVLLVLLRAVFNQARDLVSHAIVAGAIDRLRARAWDALLHCEWRTLSAMRRSDGTALLITEVERFGGGLGQLIGALGTLLTLAGLTLGALVIAPWVTAAAIVLGGVGLLVYARVGGGGARGHGEHLGEANRAVHAAFTEGLGALRVIKSFGQETRSAATGAAATDALRQAERRFLAGLGRGQIALQTGGAACLAGFVWLAVTWAHADVMLILPLVALALRALPLLAVLHHTWQNWSYARPALSRTAALIAQAEVAREPDAIEASASEVIREIALDGVTVRFAGRAQATVECVALRLPVGTITALVGPSGAGKSTIADVLGGLLTPQEGALTIDGAPLADEARRGWRRRVAYVQQDAWLAAGSLRDNLCWADDTADDTRMAHALRLSAADFALALPEGLDTRLGDGGRALSGGERQRIVLARGLLRDPALLILDEATSALDPDSEAVIARAVAGLRGTMTILVIGHRGALTALADRTVRIEHGRVVASDSGAAIK